MFKLIKLKENKCTFKNVVRVQSQYEIYLQLKQHKELHIHYEMKKEKGKSMILNTNLILLNK